MCSCLRSFEFPYHRTPGGELGLKRGVGRQGLGLTASGNQFCGHPFARFDVHHVECQLRDVYLQLHGLVGEVYRHHEGRVAVVPQECIVVMRRKNGGC